MLRYFRIKLFPNITTLFYRSQLHVPLHVRNRGWGSRYRGLGILNPNPDFCFWNYKKFSYVSKKCSDIFESNCFLTWLLYFIGHSYMFHCMSGIEGGGQDTQATVFWPPPCIPDRLYDNLPRQFEKGKYLRNIYFAKLLWFYNCSIEEHFFKTSEAHVWVGVKIPRPRYLDPTLYSWHIVLLVTKTVWKRQISKEQLLC